MSGDVGLEVGVELDGGREEVEHDGQQLPTTLQAVPTTEEALNYHYNKTAICALL